MVRKSVQAAPLLPKKVLSRRSIERCIERLQGRIDELRSFDIKKVRSDSTPEIDAMSASIRDTLDRCFGEGSGAFNRLSDACSLSWSPTVFTDTYPQTHHYQAATKENIDRAIALLEEGQRSLREDLSDTELDEEQPPAKSTASEPTNKVFVVHGHDRTALQTLARFLEKLGLETIILDEQPDQGRTIIDKFEAYASQVAFAVVLLTPDDVGAARVDVAGQVRARQNVLYELGFFVGRLGRGRTCLLRKGETEIPSDLYGVLYTRLDDGDGWRLKLARELRAAGLKFDAEKVL